MMDILDAYNMESDLSDEKKLSDVDKGSLIHELTKVRELAVNLDQIIEKSLDGIFITDGKANIIRINRSYEMISGLKREKLIGTNVRELEGKIISESCTLIALRTKQPVTIEQSIFLTNKKVLVSCNPIFNKNGKIILVVSNVRDMTKIEQLQRQIFQKDELVSKYKTELDLIKQQVSAGSDMIAEDKKMLEILFVAQRVAHVDSTVFLQGETGVGKEEIAKYIHTISDRAKYNFIRINCGAIPDNLFESELFGYAKGAFTGANTDGKIGLFEIADKGTIFLDEISELPVDMQVKLLRVLQDREITRIGAVEPIKVNVRIVAATNKSPDAMAAMVETGAFREDLFYRINVIPINIPPLRERRADIVPLLEHYVRVYNKQYGFEKETTLKLCKHLQAYEWPGNVRELKNVTEHAVIMSLSNVLDLSDFPLKNNRFPAEIFADAEASNLKKTMENIEREYILKAYKQHGSIRKAAAMLGMTHSTFANKLKYYTRAEAPAGK
ncbi:MAG: sigma 54-interacting transcriptional regulator [Clostridiales Family XIII bacterium]|jgi:PAS domain S-box-containing protein/TyrR family helix-turn-helix protein|nr:sigma 54-interacting transcriptional regulator [Clostridiales Family XIII bacterium]